jgi:tRNA pseudouridine38-40 synthase
VTRPLSEFTRNIRLIVAYDGTNYHGFQTQPDAVTIQSTLKTAIERILDHETKIIGAARTDAGVHAMGQVVNFTTNKTIAHDNLIRGLNTMLPTDIRITDAIDVTDDFHARYSAKSKVYVYCILNRRDNSPFLTRYVHHEPFPLNIPLMRQAVSAIVGEHDFSAFKKKDEIYHDTVRHVIRANVVLKREMIFIIIEATGFLRYMVRNITGTIILVGKERITPDYFREILESRTRELAGPTAPARGLFLRRVNY